MKKGKMLPTEECTTQFEAGKDAKEDANEDEREGREEGGELQVSLDLGWPA